MSKTKLSVVLATKNEEQNIGSCLESVKSIADEIIVVDEYSTDKTVEIARKFGAKVFEWRHKKNFHETKQKALDMATGDWILQLDADERVTKSLASEIKKIIRSGNNDLLKRVLARPERPKGVEGSRDERKKLNLFARHQRLVEQRQSRLGKKSARSLPAGRQVVAFFIPRVNYFLKKPLIHGGVYPDGVIRLIKRGKARFPAKSVHELMEIDGEVAWLFNDLEHHDSPTFQRYLDRANRYTDLTARQFKSKYESKRSYFKLFYYSFIKPCTVFLNLYIRHKGFLDGMRGFIWSLFSALHFPLAYFKYWQMEKE